MKTLQYKGFIGTIEVEDDLSLYGKVLGLDKSALVTYVGMTVPELEADFHEAVDDYIDYCKEHNLPLHKSYSGSFNVRITPELHARIAMSAQSSGMSLNAYIQKLLSAAML
ncbi:MAG: type II toxin-antitoxin system HicB family antitoxin [Bacteroidales bacterium]|nr:type II toxin-antitoxin system HicB family antitoxin [Bacteroidales bacterium]